MLKLLQRYLCVLRYFGTLWKWFLGWFIIYLKVPDKFFKIYTLPWCWFNIVLKMTLNDSKMSCNIYFFHLFENVKHFIHKHTHIIYTYISIYTHTHIYIYLYINIHICTHIYIQLKVKSLHTPCRICKMLIILPSKRDHKKCMLLFI